MSTGPPPPNLDASLIGENQQSENGQAFLTHLDARVGDDITVDVVVASNAGLVERVTDIGVVLVVVVA